MTQINIDGRSILSRRRALLGLSGGLLAVTTVSRATSVPVIYDQRQFLVCFNVDDSTLTQEVSGGINEAVTYILARLNANDDSTRNGRIVIVGHADSAEGATDKVALSKARALRVADKLVELGVPGDMIAVDWKGDSRPATWLNDKSQAAANRCVTIDPVF